MNKATIVLMMLTVWSAGARTARAQDELIETGFINIDGGAQPQRRTVTASTSSPLYDETLTATSVQRIRNGIFFDVSAGYRVGHNLAAGVGYSQFGRPGTGAVTASIPNPDFYDRPLLIAATANNLTHTERAIHGRITYFLPVSSAFSVSVSGGPSYIMVEQAFATGISIAPGTQTYSLGNEKETGHAFGANGGADGTFMFTPSVGVGVVVHYVYGKLDLPSLKGFTVGGVQGGVGLRVRF